MVETTDPKTCTYEAHRNHPSNWHGETPNDWWLAKDSWSCPHNRLDHEAIHEPEYCPFHMDPENVPDDVNEAEEFVRVINEESSSDDPVEAQRKKEFVGATFGEFKIEEGTILDTLDDFSIRFDHTSFQEGITAMDVHFKHDVTFSGAKFSDVVYFSYTKFNVDNYVDFSRTEFSSDSYVDFSRAEFSGGGYVDFILAEFRGDKDVSFVGTKFDVNGGVSFYEAEFSGDGNVDFSFSEFNGRSGGQFQNAKFRGSGEVNFSFSEFKGSGSVGFQGAEFSGGGQVIFENTIFSGSGNVNFSNSIIENAKFSSKDVGYTTDVNFSSKFRVDGVVNFSHAILRETDFSGVNLQGADFRWATLRKTDFSDAILKRSDFRYSDINDIDLSGETNLAEANFSFTDFTEEKHRDVNFSHAILREVDFTGAVLSRARFNHAQVCRADFTDATLFETDFSNAQAHGTVFNDAKCRNSIFEYANLEEASFVNSDLYSAKFEKAIIYEASYADCKINPDTTIDSVHQYESENEICDDHKQIQLYKRRAWTYNQLRRLLVQSGQIRKVLQEQYYLKEHDANINKAKLEAQQNKGNLNKTWLRWARLWITKWIIRISDEWKVLAILVGVIAAGFASAYLLTGGVSAPSHGVYRIEPRLAVILNFLRLTFFSLYILFEGTYEVMNAIIPFGLVEVVANEIVMPLWSALGGSTLLQWAGMTNMQVVSEGERLAAIQRALGVLLIVPFLLQFLQRIRLYSQAAQSEGSGLLSWLFGT